MEVVFFLEGDSWNHPAGLRDVRPGKEESREAVLASRWPLWVTRSSPSQKHRRWYRSAPRLPQVVGRGAGIFIHPSPQILAEGCPGDRHFCSCGPCRFQWPETDLRQIVAGLVVQSCPVSGEERMVTKGSWTGHRWHLPLLAVFPELISLLDVSWLRASNPSSY